MGDRCVKFVSRLGGTCFDITSASAASSAKLIQYTCGTGTNQQFTRGA
ncbi:RICIN domain-containing protein [Streptomyces fuscichromogenes]|nr:RICIN domain-containing protein [Streptomyces fuscichromogenes]